MGGKMNTLLLLIAALLVALVLVAVLKNGKGKSAQKNAEAPRRKPFLTEREQAMHNRLTQSLPDLAVFAQVSFGALLTAKSYAARNTFDRKMADFVVCDRAFQVIAVIELDDKTHKNKKEEDAKRDALLERAGYRVIRYANVPDVQQIQRDFTPAPLTATPVAASKRQEPTLEPVREASPESAT